MKNLLPVLLLLLSLSAFSQKWQHQSSAFGDIPLSWKTNQQTASLPLDIDNDGVEEIILGGRVAAPALIYLKYDRAIGWREFVIEKALLTIETGGAFYDIDGDGDKDVVFGNDLQGNKMWWWENPYPYFNPNVPWKRYEIKKSGGNQHHDQVFGDFKQTGRSQLAFWNQSDKAIYIADIPQDPRAGAWKYEKVYEGSADQTKNWYPEGCDAADVDGDGYEDLIAGNYWFKYDIENKKFKAIKIGNDGGRIRAAKFKVGKRQQFVISPGDGSGRLMYYETDGNAEITENWKGKDLIGRELTHVHTLEVADVNNDGNLDIFVAEMVQWSNDKVDNPKAEAFILYGDGMGNFEKTIFQRGFDFHEGRLMDIDGDGDIDVVSKPYTWNAPRIDMWLQNGTGTAYPKINKETEGRIGLELYSLRDYLKTDISGTLKYVKDLGITEVEVAGFPKEMSSAEIKMAIDEAGLQSKSALMGFEDFDTDIEKIIADAKVLGVRYVGMAWIPHRQNQFGLKESDKAIEVFNRAGERLAQEGMHLFYHGHGYEFKQMDDGSGTYFDYIVRSTNPVNVSYECDVYWAFHGGQDPTLLLRKYPGRFVALHLKDMAYGQSTGEYSGGTPLTSDVALGTGQINFTPIMRAAIDTGVKFYFIEDENADVKKHLPITLRYMKGLR
jgi:sugar phosphate isomerase/epimerase